ncbi:hypothetical protein O9929_05550 [Vibrio lentus]|nr:hypothetical protein [Vibrio lentus]
MIRVSANIAAGYAISYVLVDRPQYLLFIKYPLSLELTPVKAGKEAEAEFSTGDDNEKPQYLWVLRCWHSTH